MVADDEFEHIDPITSAISDPFTRVLKVLPRDFIHSLTQYLGYHDATQLLTINHAIHCLIYDYVDQFYDQHAIFRDNERIRIAHTKIGFVDGLDSPGFADTDSILQDCFEISFSESVESALRLSNLRGQLSAYSLLVPSAHPLSSSVNTLNKDVNNQLHDEHPWIVYDDGSAFTESSRSLTDIQVALSRIVNNLSYTDSYI